ncbi:hypothetical protein MW887_005771 [Aspergillus wentii]|nr:hypothetical protein MW887_005771 [Aspergillus wentii]
MALFKTTKKHLSGALTAGSFTKETLSPFVQIVTRVLEESFRQTDCQDHGAIGDGASMRLHLIVLENVARTNEERDLSSFALGPMPKFIEDSAREGLMRN